MCTLCGVNLPCISVSRTAPMRCLVIMYYLLVRSNRMLLFDDNIGACRHARSFPTQATRPSITHSRSIGLLNKKSTLFMCGPLPGA